MASNSTATEHYGKGFDTTEYTLESLQKQGRCCQGTHSKEWYTLIKNETDTYAPSSFIFCEYCAKNSMSGRVKKITHEELERNKYIKFDCSMSKNLTDYGITRMISDCEDQFTVNVNIVDPKDERVFAPGPILTGEKGIKAASVGAAIVPLPSGCYPEISIKCSEPMRDNYYIVQCKTGTGRHLKFLDSSGRNFYTPTSKPFTIDSFVMGDGSKRIWYSTASQLERDSGIASEDEDLSNKFFITIILYKRIKKVFYEEPVVYRSSRSPMAKGGRSKKKKISTNGSQMRGAGTIRGGATYEADGRSEFTETQLTEDNFVELSKHELTVQLVNTETEEVLVEEARRIQQQVDAAREMEIEKLRLQILEKEKEGETTRGSVLRGHTEQMNALI